MNEQTTPSTDNRLHIIRHPDPVLNQVGHPVQSAYVETFWLPILGPTPLLLIRRLDRDLDQHQEPLTINPPEIAIELGLMSRGNKHGPIRRAFERAARLGAIQITGTQVAIRSHLHPLTPTQVSKLPPNLQTLHQQLNNQASSKLS